jgi:hypothetical protein
MRGIASPPAWIVSLFRPRAVLAVPVKMVGTPQTPELPPSAKPAPTIAERIVSQPVPDPPLLRLPPDELARQFLRWHAEHGLPDKLTVDDVFWYASEDFALALGFALPPRRVFLGALQKQQGVTVRYDVRRPGKAPARQRGKTTEYSFRETRVRSPASAARRDVLARAA